MPIAYHRRHAWPLTASRPPPLPIRQKPGSAPPRQPSSAAGQPTSRPNALCTAPRPAHAPSPPQPCYNATHIIALADSIDLGNVQNATLHPLPFAFRRVGPERRYHILGTWTKVLAAREVLGALPPGVDLHVSDQDVVSRQRARAR